MWKNRTSHPRPDDKGKEVTTTLELEELTIVVTKHMHHGDELMMFCENVGIRGMLLDVTDMQKGQQKAVRIVDERLRKMMALIGQAKI